MAIDDPVNWTALRYFEAAARLGNMTLAGEEVLRTPHAISQQIKALEDNLQCQLFTRSNKGVALTPAGREYYLQVRVALEAVKDAGRYVGRQRSESMLVVSVLPTFLNRWLSPRLRRFTAINPEIELHIGAEYRAVDFASENVDLAVRYGDGEFAGLTSHLLFQETNTPVCTVDVLGEILGGRSHAKLRPDDVLGTPLLFSKTCALNWNEWFDFVGSSAIQPSVSGIHYDSCLGTITGARDGVGIAIANLPYVQKDLASGELVAPFEIIQPMPKGWYIVYPADHANMKKVQLFRTWLMGEAAIMTAEIASAFCASRSA